MITRSGALEDSDCCHVSSLGYPWNGTCGRTGGIVEGTTLNGGGVRRRRTVSYGYTGICKTGRGTTNLEPNGNATRRGGASHVEDSGEKKTCLRHQSRSESRGSGKVNRINRVGSGTGRTCNQLTIDTENHNNGRTSDRVQNTAGEIGGGEGE